MVFRSVCKRDAWNVINIIPSRRTSFVPECSNEISKLDIDKLYKFLISSKSLVVLTGAGISTESGLPDYRSEKVGLYARSTHRPMTYQEFIKSPAARQRYWARSYLGWSDFSSKLPNRTHKILASWEKSNIISHIITQNVDRLHHKAGSQKIIELHGTLYEVYCLKCGYREAMDIYQDRLSSLNSDWLTEQISSECFAPDGDVIIPQESVASFKVASCGHCGSGPIKPDVVFFGENVDPTRRDLANDLISSADALHCLGSSLQTYSSFRLVLLARERSIPIACINIGETRADEYFNTRIASKASAVLTVVDETLK